MGFSYRQFGCASGDKSFVKISLCLPTYNRAKHLQNCLRSIAIATQNHSREVELCISDNCSTDETQFVVESAGLNIAVRYFKQSSNVGISRNFLKAVSLAKGEFAWLIGDDDLLLPDTIERLFKIVDAHAGVDFIYVNAFHLNTDYVFSFPQPFDTHNLPVSMPRFSLERNSRELRFTELIDPAISFDFLGGMFLSVFRREGWNKCCNVLDISAIYDNRVFSHFDNTFPHVKIFAFAFSNSLAYFNEVPLIVSLTGAREWAPMYPLVRSVRLPEALQVYREAGLPYLRYLRCRNFALKSSIPDLLSMILYSPRSGIKYISIFKFIANGIVFPYFILSPVFYVIKLIRRKINI